MKGTGKGPGRGCGVQGGLALDRWMPHAMRRVRKIVRERAEGWRWVKAWLGILPLLLTAGCSPSTFLARRMVEAPNRVPEFVKPEGRVWLMWEAGLLERFPSRTNRVGDPAVDLRWVVVEPGDYGWSMRSTTETNGTRPREVYTMDLRLPPKGLPPARAAVGTAYVLHGYGVDLETMLPWGLFLAEAGWRTVLVDLPGHGLSGGRRVTFGVKEVGALRALREALAAEKGWGGPTVVVGHSMGAALALRWQAADPGVSGSVALGPYAEFAPAVLRLRDDYARWVPRGWVRNAAKKVPGLLGVGARELDTVSVVRGMRLRAMLVASASDVVTPPEDSAELRWELGAGSEFLIVGQATHETLPYLFQQHGERVREWLRGAVPGSGEPAGASREAAIVAGP